CLSSRIPHGEEVTPEKLRMIEAAENLLRDLGFYDVRVRHHQLGSPRSEAVGQQDSPPSGLRHLARIEVGQEEIPKLLTVDAFARVAEPLKKIGYAYVTVDLQGYRRGSLNEQGPGHAT